MHLSKGVLILSIMDWKESLKKDREKSTSALPAWRFWTPNPRLSVMKSLLSWRVMVPSKSVKKIYFGLVRSAGRPLGIDPLWRDIGIEWTIWSSKKCFFLTSKNMNDI